MIVSEKPHGRAFVKATLQIKKGFDGERELDDYFKEYPACAYSTQILDRVPSAFSDIEIVTISRLKSCD